LSLTQETKSTSFMKVITTLALLAVTSAALAQNQSTSQINADFNNVNELSDWKWLHETEGWPNKVKAFEVKDGNLKMEMGTSGWFADKNAPFLYKEISGDFDVQARLMATGVAGGLSETLWSLGGLMVRVPKKTSKDQWKPKEENWMFMTTGVAEEAGKPVIETKYTINSKSNLKLRDAKAAWITLRITRVGNAFVMMYKYDKDKTWTVHDRFYLVDWPSVLQVGLNGYTNSNAVPGNILWGDPFKFNNENFDHLGKPDFVLTVDFVHFAKPKINYDAPGQPGKQWLNQVYANRLVDYSVSNQEVLKLLGE
jgi:regulation of enolase protein 1 (concanavalin A-like superfamily)